MMKSDKFEAFVEKHLVTVNPSDDFAGIVNKLSNPDLDLERNKNSRFAQTIR